MSLLLMGSTYMYTSADDLPVAPTCCPGSDDEVLITAITVRAHIQSRITPHTNQHHKASSLTVPCLTCLLVSLRRPCLQARIMTTLIATFDLATCLSTSQLHVLLALARTTPQLHWPHDASWRCMPDAFARYLKAIEGYIHSSQEATQAFTCPTTLYIICCYRASFDVLCCA
jgi:hypothetical protein